MHECYVEEIKKELPFIPEINNIVAMYLDTQDIFPEIMPDFKERETILITGKINSGKTTLIKDLLKQYEYPVYIYTTDVVQYNHMYTNVTNNLENIRNVLNMKNRRVLVFDNFLNERSQINFLQNLVTHWAKEMNLVLIISTDYYIYLPMFLSYKFDYFFITRDVKFTKRMRIFNNFGHLFVKDFYAFCKLHFCLKKSSPKGSWIVLNNKYRMSKNYKCGCAECGYYIGDMKNNFIFSL